MLTHQRAAFARDLASWRPYLYKLALRLTRDTSAAEDLAQETCYRALRSYRSLAENTDMRAWLSRILRNQHIDWTRREGREIPMPYVDPASPCEEVPAPAWVKFSDEDLVGAVESLPNRYREVYTLFSVERLTHEAIAQRLGVKAATIGSRIFRARALMRATLLNASLPVDGPPSGGGRRGAIRDRKRTDCPVPVLGP